MANIKDRIRSIIRENFIKEMGINDTHLKAIMKYYDKGTPSTKKQVAIVVSANKNANRGMILNDLMDMDYHEILDVESGTTAFRYYEKRAMRKEKDDEFIRHDCKDRITKLEALLAASSKEKDELRKMVLDMTAKVAELSVKVEFLTKENDKLVKTPRNKKLLNG